MLNTKQNVNTQTEITLPKHKTWTIEGNRHGEVLELQKRYAVDHPGRRPEGLRHRSGQKFLGDQTRHDHRAGIGSLKV